MAQQLPQINWKITPNTIKTIVDSLKFIFNYKKESPCIMAYYDTYLKPQFCLPYYTVSMTNPSVQ